MPRVNDELLDEYCKEDEDGNRTLGKPGKTSPQTGLTIDAFCLYTHVSWFEMDNGYRHFCQPNPGSGYADQG